MESIDYTVWFAFLYQGEIISDEMITLSSCSKTMFDIHSPINCTHFSLLHGHINLLEIISGLFNPNPKGQGITL